jgi:hypothetical protein
LRCVPFMICHAEPLEYRVTRCHACLSIAREAPRITATYNAVARVTLRDS